MPTPPWLPLADYLTSRHRGVLALPRRGSACAVGARPRAAVGCSRAPRRGRKGLLAAAPLASAARACTCRAAAPTRFLPCARRARLCRDGLLARLPLIRDSTACVRRRAHRRPTPPPRFASAMSRCEGLRPPCASPHCKRSLAATSLPYAVLSRSRRQSLTSRMGRDNEERIEEIKKE